MGSLEGVTRRDLKQFRVSRLGLRVQGRVQVFELENSNAKLETLRAGDLDDDLLFVSNDVERVAR